MRLLSEVLGRVRALLWRAREEREMEEELAFHLEMETQQNLQAGMSPEEARRHALLAFGGSDKTKEEVRDARGTRWAEDLQRDLRLALRSLRRTPAFTVAVIAILALAIGMATAMFTIYKTVLVDRLPIRAQDRVVIMHPLDRSGRHLDVLYAYLPEIARDSALFRGVAGVYHLGARPAPFMDGTAPVALTWAWASPNLFDVLGVRPVIGRLFRAEDGEKGAPPVMVLSYAAWCRYFGGDPSVVGRILVGTYRQVRWRIIGVAPPGFEYPTGAEAWLPVPPDFDAQVDIVARLASHVTIDGARAGLFALTQHRNPFADTPGMQVYGVAAEPFADAVLGSLRPALIALTLAVGLLLLIACVNIGNLSLVRLLGRSREIAIRRAIGASSADVMRLFAAENALLGTLGGVLGLGTAMVLLRVVRAGAPPQLPRTAALDAVGAPLAAAVAITLIALLLFGVLPSLMASRISSYTALRSGARSGAESRSRRQAREWLVAVQIALAVVMLAGAGLLVRTLAHLESADLGYRPEHLSILSFSFPQSAIPTDSAAFEAARQLVRHVETRSGVVAASSIESDPFKWQSFFIMRVARAEQPAIERERSPFVPFEFVGPDYFRTFEIPILHGRGFISSDTRGAERVVVVNETLARQLWPEQDALGRRLVVMGDDAGTFTVVGIARDTRFRELRNVGSVAYFNLEQVARPYWLGYVAVRTTSSLAAMLPALRVATHDVMPDLVLWDAKTMDQLLDAPLAQPRLSALLLAGFSLVALLLSAVGLYGVLASGVRRQTHDIGVRVALGATAGNIRRLVLGQVSGVVAIGAVVGLAGALATSRLLRSLLFQVSPTDPLTLAGVCLLLLVVALLAAYIPARRAARVDPVEALRTE